MCLKVENSSSVIGESIALFELPLFIKDEIGQTYSTSCLYAQMPAAVINLKGYLLSKHYVDEDG